MPVAAYGFVVAGAIAGGFVSGLAGFGTALMALGIWLYVLPPSIAVPLVIVCSIWAYACILRGSMNGRPLVAPDETGVCPPLFAPAPPPAGVFDENELPGAEDPFVPAAAPVCPLRIRICTSRSGSIKRLIFSAR